MRCLMAAQTTDMDTELAIAGPLTQTRPLPAAGVTTSPWPPYIYLFLSDAEFHLSPQCTNKPLWLHVLFHFFTTYSIFPSSPPHTCPSGECPQQVTGLFFGLQGQPVQVGLELECLLHSYYI